MELTKRFWSKVDKSAGPAECWPWTAAHLKKGYGVFGINGKNRLAHRVAFTLVNGNIPEGLCVCHSCDNPPCCNPTHLWVGTHTDNLRDMSVKGRGGTNRGTRNKNSILTPEIVRAIRADASPQPKGPGIKVGSHRWLAAKYGVSRATIQQLLEGKSWNWVD